LEKKSGRVAVIVRALYGLKSSGAAWHTFFAQSLTDLGFVPCKEADPDVWRRVSRRKQEDNSQYYEYILVYVDDCLIVSEEPKVILSRLEDDYKYRLKDVGPPTRFLGAIIGRTTLEDGFETWYISAESYLEKAIKAIEERFGKLDTLFSSR
jgi:Reverse transcriptase (RNA-dependent DNA polymerase)